MTIPIIFVLDTSGNNAEYTANLNDAMFLFEKKLRSSFCSLEHRPVISVITYSSTSKIVVNAVDVEDFFWEPLSSGGLSDLGQGLKNLESVINNTYKRNDAELHNSNFVTNPIIALVTRNDPTDNYEKELNSLKQKEWFLKATRVAFFQGDIIADNVGMFADFTGSVESTNISVSELSSVIMEIYKGKLAEYEDSTGDFMMNDLLHVDPIGEHTIFNLEIMSKNYELKDKLEIARCQVIPCEPSKANDTIIKFINCGENISAENNGLDCKVKLCIGAHNKRIIKGFFDKEVKLDFPNDSQHNFSFFFSKTEGTLTLCNEGEVDLYIKYLLDYNEVAVLSCGDMILDFKDNVIAYILKHEVHDLPGSTGGDIPSDGWITGDDGWD